RGKSAVPGSVRNADRRSAGWPDRAQWQALQSGSHRGAAALPATLSPTLVSDLEPRERAVDRPARPEHPLRLSRVTNGRGFGRDGQAVRTDLAGAPGRR